MSADDDDDADANDDGDDDDDGDHYDHDHDVHDDHHHDMTGVHCTLCKNASFCVSCNVLHFISIHCNN